MDLDAYTDAHRAEWDRLAVLVGTRRLDGAQADELVGLYQRVGTHLSVIRSSAPDPMLVSRLSTLLARARASVTGRPEPAWRDVVRFLVVSFPAALYRTRRWWGIAAAASLVLAVVVGWWVAAHPQVQAALISSSDAQQLVGHDFESYYSEHAASAFAAQVWTNNAWIAAQCIAMGVLGVPVLYVLATNALNVGIVGGLMVAGGRAGLFFGLILPHGLLELTAVFIAAGAGLRLFWCWVEPGPRTRGRALAEEGRAVVAVAMGLVLVLAVSGAIEAFVTPSGLPTWARIGIGAGVEALFLTYVFTLGRWAVRRGETGDLEPALLAASVPTRA